MGLVEDGRYSDPKDELSEEYSVDEYAEPEPEPKPVAKLHRRPHAVRSDATASAPAPAAKVPSSAKSTTANTPTSAS